MQDGKNLIMAIVLCLLVVVGWSYLADYMGWVVKPDPAEIAKMEAAQAEQAQKAQAEAEAKQKAQAEPLPAFTPAPGVDVTVDAPLYKAVLHSGGGVLRSFELKKYTSGLDEDSPRINMVDPQTAAVAPLGLVINGQPSWSTGKWALESDSGVTVAEGGKGVVRLVGEVDNLRVTRELTFNSENYLISEKVSLATLGTDTRSVRVRYTVAADTSNAANTNYDAMRVAWDNGGSLGEETSTDKLTKEGVEASGKLYWAGPMSTYFLSAVMPGDADEARMVGRMQGSVYRVALGSGGGPRPGDHPRSFLLDGSQGAQDAGRRVRPAGPQRGPGHVQHHRQGPAVAAGILPAVHPQLGPFHHHADHRHQGRVLAPDGQELLFHGKDEEAPAHDGQHPRKV